MVQRLLNDWQANSPAPGRKAICSLLQGGVYPEELKNEDLTLGRSYQENCVEAGKYLRGKLSQLAETVEDNFPEPAP
ncbi:MAG: hypothetical protein R3D26_08230 [Cyanobacteriota/Melainabacteria group bacterium]